MFIKLIYINGNSGTLRDGEPSILYNTRLAFRYFVFTPIRASAIAYSMEFSLPYYLLYAIDGLKK